uniref:Periaxin n=1 Tax=Nothobranchius kuhntae TaxID=321403 RepID=A0A1A8HQY9_NOTKU
MRGDVSLPKVKSPEVDISLKGPDIEVGKVDLPDVDVSLPKGKLEGDFEGKLQGTESNEMPHIKMTDVYVSPPKGKIECPEREIKGEEGKTPHITLPSIEISLPKGKFEGPNVEGNGKATFKTPYMKMPSADISMPKEATDNPDTEMKGHIRGNFRLPNVRMPNVEISLPKGKDAPEMEIEGKFKMPKVDIALPERKYSPEGPGIDINKDLKLPKSAIDTKGPQIVTELDKEFHRGEGRKAKSKGELPRSDLSTAGTCVKVEEPKGKGKNIRIGMQKRKKYDDVTVDGKPRGKDPINNSAAVLTLPKTDLKSGEEDQSAPSQEIKVPRIPDIDFDIGTSQDEEDDKTEKDKKVYIPKFGVPLPSLASPERRANVYGSEVQYEGPKMPKVKKAVFVMVNPDEADEPAKSTSIQKEEKLDEKKIEEVKVKMPKIKMKPNFGKSKEKSSTACAEMCLNPKEKSNEETIKMPKVSFPSDVSGSYDFAPKDDGSESSFNGESEATPYKGSKDDRGAISGKIKLPKVEFSSPYSKMAAGAEKAEMKDRKGKDSSTMGDVKGLHTKPAQMIHTSDTVESSKYVVSSHARTEMLDRDSSESPVSFSTEISSTRIQTRKEAAIREVGAEEKESSWFKVPKITLKPHTSGFLQITPEGSPQAQRRGEIAGDTDISGSFCLHSTGLDCSTQSEEHHVSSTEEGTVTMVTKTTRITHLVTSETGESTTCQVSDV